MDSKRSCVIYGLAASSNPDRVRYIGQTTLALDLRLRLHINQARYNNRTAVQKWINRHVADGDSILMITLMADAAHNWDEQRFIAEYLAAGIELLNHTEGGGGVYGYKHTAEECLARGERVRAFMAARAPERWEELKRQVSAKLKGRALPAEQRAKMAAAHTGDKNHFYGKSHTEASRIANAKARAKLTDDQVREMRQRYAAGEKQDDLAAAFGIASSQVSVAVRRKTYWWVD